MRSRTKKTAAFRYFHNSTPSAGKPSTITNLNKLFDKYRGKFSVHTVMRS